MKTLKVTKKVKSVAVSPPATYDILLADPPWPYADAGNRHGGIDAHYPPMSLADLAALGGAVQRVTRKNAHLYMWTTHAFVKEAIELFPAWGFKYKTAVPWLKLTKSRQPLELDEVKEGDVHFGPGYYFRGCTEWLLLGVRGSKPPRSRSERSFIISPVRGHSVKPPEQYGKIERLSYEAGVSRGLELFARRGAAERPAWMDTWGNEAPDAVRLPGWPL